MMRIMPRRKHEDLQSLQYCVLVKFWLKTYLGKLNCGRRHRKATSLKIDVADLCITEDM